MEPEDTDLGSPGWGPLQGTLVFFRLPMLFLRWSQHGVGGTHKSSLQQTLKALVCHVQDFVTKSRNRQPVVLSANCTPILNCLEQLANAFPRRLPHLIFLNASQSAYLQPVSKSTSSTRITQGMGTLLPSRLQRFFPRESLNNAQILAKSL